jgi:hypothetical protein
MTFVSDARSKIVSSAAGAAAGSNVRRPKDWRHLGALASPTSTEAAGNARASIASCRTRRASSNVFSR